MYIQIFVTPTFVAQFNSLSQDLFLQVRPIVISQRFCLAPCSVYVDECLKTFLPLLPTILRDSTGIVEHYRNTGCTPRLPLGYWGCMFSLHQYFRRRCNYHCRHYLQRIRTTWNSANNRNVETNFNKQLSLLYRTWTNFQTDLGNSNRNPCCSHYFPNLHVLVCLYSLQLLSSVAYQKSIYQRRIDNIYLVNINP